MMMMTMMANTIPYRRTKTHIWDKVLMGIWVHPSGWLRWSWAKWWTGQPRRSWWGPCRCWRRYTYLQALTCWESQLCQLLLDLYSAKVERHTSCDTTLCVPPNILWSCVCASEHHLCQIKIICNQERHPAKVERRTSYDSTLCVPPNISRFTQIELIQKKPVWLNCCCWENWGMVEGRFSKWF